MPRDRQLSVSEMKRILKPAGRAYLSAGWPPFGYVTRAEWQSILEGFSVERGGGRKENWALVALRSSAA